MMLFSYPGDLIVSTAHDWRYTGDGWKWTSPPDGVAPRWDDLKRTGYTRRECMDCGRIDAAPFPAAGPCRMKFEHPDSGFGGPTVRLAAALAVTWGPVTLEIALTRRAPERRA